MNIQKERTNAPRSTFNLPGRASLTFQLPSILPENMALSRGRDPLDNGLYLLLTGLHPLWLAKLTCPDKTSRC